MAKRRPRQLEHAKSMRRNPTWGELRLWEAVRRSRLGVRFRRQEPLGPFVADFVCHSHRIVVEVDGISHGFGDHAYAECRDRWLRERGWAVLHFSDEALYRNLEGVLETISAVLEDLNRQWDLQR